VEDKDVNMARILFIEHGLSLQPAFERLFHTDGHDLTVELYGPRALELATNEVYELIVLEVRLPALDGFEIARVLWERTDTPIMVVSADSHGVNLPARSLSPAAVALRPQPAAAWPAMPGPAEVLSVGPLTVDLRQWLVTLGTREIVLSTREFRVLALFLAHAGRSWSRRQIIDRLWEAGYNGSDRAVDVCISRLRRQVLADPECPVDIVAQPGHGYRLIHHSVVASADGQPA
jgi:DNA-binding response OmpR family regulator